MKNKIATWEDINYIVNETMDTAFKLGVVLSKGNVPEDDREKTLETLKIKILKSLEECLKNDNINTEIREHVSSNEYLHWFYTYFIENGTRVLTNNHELVKKYVDKENVKLLNEFFIYLIDKATSTNAKVSEIKDENGNVFYTELFLKMNDNYFECARRIKDDGTIKIFITQTNEYEMRNNYEYLVINLEE